MSSTLNSIGQFIGTSGGPTITAPTNQYANNAQGLMNQYNGTIAPGSTAGIQQTLANPIYQQGQSGLQNQLSTINGQAGTQAGILSNLQNQGFTLQPQDQSLYGQESDSITRQMGQAAQADTNNLANRGLSDSGAAGATFSGLQGTQNEMLAGAQQQIAQQRFQNTQNQIAQQQNFLGNLYGQGNQAASASANLGQSALNSTNSNNLAGYNSIMGANAQAANAQNQVGQQSIEAQEGTLANQPQNAFTFGLNAVNQVAGAAGKSVGQAAGNNLSSSLFSSGA